MHDHFTGNDGTRWTTEKIAAKQFWAILLMVGGALGIITFFLAFFFVRRALDEDKAEDIRKWTLISGITGIVPGIVFGGLLELFIWRAHAAESFTIFGLLGKAPQEAPPQPMAPAPAQVAAIEAQKRKSEYEMLFTTPAPAAPAAPDYGYAQAPAYGYGEPAQAEYAQQPAAAQEAYAMAPPETGAGVAAEPAPVEAGTQYQQPSGAPICTCGRPMEWVPEYNRYYCYTDDKYEGET